MLQLDLHLFQLWTTIIPPNYLSKEYVLEVIRVVALPKWNHRKLQPLFFPQRLTRQQYTHTHTHTISSWTALQFT